MPYFKELGLVARAPAQTAKVFWSGRSQAVRLPKAFRLNAKEVTIRRDGEALVLEPVADEWAWLEDLRDLVMKDGVLDEDFVAAVNDQPPTQERPEIEAYFKSLK